MVVSQAARAPMFPATERALRSTRRWTVVAGVVAAWDVFCLTYWAHAEGVILGVRLATLVLHLPFFFMFTRSILRLRQATQAMRRTREHYQGERQQPHWRLQ